MLERAWPWQIMPRRFGIMMLALNLPRLVGGAYLTTQEVGRVVSDFKVCLETISAREGSSWLVRLHQSLFESQPMLPPCVYLIAGNDPVAPGMVDVLPIPSTRRLLPSPLRDKDFFGEALSWAGYEAWASWSRPCCCGSGDGSVDLPSSRAL